MDLLQGVGFFVPHEPDERNRDFVLDHLYDEETLPNLCSAVERLDRELKSATGGAADVLERQRDHIRLAYLYQRSLRNWFEAGRYIAPGKKPGRGRSMTRIVDDEIQVTNEMIALTDGRADQLLLLNPLGDTMMYAHGPGYVAKLKQRVAVMKQHRNNPPRDLTPGMKALIDYWKEIDEESKGLLKKKGARS